MGHRRLLAGLLLSLFACAPGTVEASPSLWEFRARYDEASGQLAVASCSASAHDLVRFTSGLRGAALHRIQAEREGSRALHGVDDDLLAVDWQLGECLRTRIDLAAAARTAQPRLSASSDYVLLDPRRWLWRPESLDPNSTLVFSLPPGGSVSVPWTPLADAPNTYRLGATPADWPALSAFGRFEERSLARRGGTLRLTVLPPWSAREGRRVEAVARALEQAYGRWPRQDTQVLIVPLPGRRDAAPWGEVMRGGGAAVHLFVGADAAPDALIEDWTAVHEFSHLLHPNPGPRGRWLGEGLASYYQHVLRARVGVLGADEAWSKIEAGFARGRAERRSEGLTLTQASQRMHETRSYMRNYWSGAAYWLEADLALRASGRSLDALLSEYAQCCLERAVQTRPEDLVAALDRLAGDDVFGSRYRRYAESTTFPEVSALRVPPELRAAIMRPRAASTAP